MQSKVKNTFIDNAEDLDIVMSMYNLLEYGDNYCITKGSLQNYYRDEVSDNANENNENNADNYRINNKTITSKSFKCKTKIIRNTPTDNNNNTTDAEVVVPLKYLSNIWRSFDLPLINCEIELDVKWTKNCVISEIYKTPEVPVNPNANPRNPLIQATVKTTTKFQVNNAKLQVLAVTLSINNNIKFLENIGKDLKKQFLGTNIDLK